MDVDAIYAARRASGLTLEEAASACGITRQTYQLREKAPTEFRIGELIGLRASMNKTGRKILHDGMVNIFLAD
ncbi:helix-turn-helix domain-containing protein [Olsenella phocaeensis]|uniref:helix-turn-helix domain-containing protein n=1 Tax=Olsenella phocaeensis TaxID=1852385 RepID=UPI003A933659